VIVARAAALDLGLVSAVVAGASAYVAHRARTAGEYYDNSQGLATGDGWITEFIQ